MSVAHLDELAFHLIGRRAGESLAPVEGGALLPALLAPYRDMAALRHDFPLVLAPGRPARPLAALIDAILEQNSADDRFAGQLRRIETALRRLAADADGISLDEACRLAAARLAGEEGLSESFARLRAALPGAAVLADCDRGLAARLLLHEWGEAQRDRTARLGALIGDLARRLDDILKADFAASTEARTAERLRASMGAAQQNSFDFEAMARLLGRVPRRGGLGESRKRRIADLLGVLRRQRFVAVPGAAAEPYEFAFDSAATALEAWRARRPEAAELARAIAMARLEASGDYDEARHDALFAAPGTGPGVKAAARDFPDYLVLLAGSKVADEAKLVLQAFGAGLPFKVLVRHDDLLDEDAPDGTPMLAVGALAMTALSLGEVFVLQSAASGLAALGETLRAGIARSGPALYSVFSGAGFAGDGPQMGGLAPYMVSAAAVESRAFPGFVYDPAAGEDWSTRFCLAGNPQPARAWPEHLVEWEDAAHHRCSEAQSFTAVEFLAADSRLAGHLAEIAPEAWTERQVAPERILAGTAGEGCVPVLMMADATGKLHRVIAGEALLSAARRCQARWKLLQELGRPLAAAQPQAAPTVPPEPTAPASVVAAPAAEETHDPDTPWIDTPRCSCCGECPHVNAKMFVYDANGQATLGDLAAGSFREMVEAAEGCPVAAIHPGKPWDAKEAGLEELCQRAAALG